MWIPDQNLHSSDWKSSKLVSEWIARERPRTFTSSDHLWFKGNDHLFPHASISITIKIWQESWVHMLRKAATKTFVNCHVRDIISALIHACIRKAHIRTEWKSSNAPCSYELVDFNSQFLCVRVCIILKHLHVWDTQ